MENINSLTSFSSNIEKKANLSFNLNDILYILLGFFMGQAQILSGLYPFSLLYWTLFIGNNRLMILTLFSTGFGLFITGDLLNLRYLIAGILGYISYLITKKNFKLQGNFFLSLFIVIFYSIISFFNYNVHGVILYDYLILSLEACSLLILIIFLRESRKKFLAGKNIGNITSIAGILISIGGLLGVSTFATNFFNFSLPLINIIILLIITAFSTRRGIETGVLLASVYGVLLSGLDIISLGIVIKYIIFALVIGSFSLWKKNERLVGVVGVFSAFLIYSGFSPTLYQLKLTLWETLVVGGLFFLIPQRFWYNFVSFFQTKKRKMINNSQNGDYSQLFKQQFLELSQVFSEMSATFSDVLPDRKKETQKRVDDFIYLFKRKNCLKCSQKEKCWTENRAVTYKKLSTLLKKIKNEGLYTRILKKYLNQCPNQKGKIAGLKNCFELLQLNNFWRDRLINKQEMVSAQLEGISNIIAKLSTHSNIGTNQKLRMENIKEKMLKNEVDIYNIESYPGNNSEKINIYIEAEPCSGNNPCQNQIIKLLTGELKSNFRLIKRECGSKLKDRPCRLVYGEQGNFYLEVTARQLPREEVAGDTYLYKQLGNGQDMIALSDGMGVGSRAARESQAAVNLLERIVEAGFTQKLAIEIINSALFLRNDDDKFTTLDITFFNTFSGEITFNKIGSASSFIKREWNVEQIKPDSLPIGILEQVEITENTKKLEKGDFIIMFSDGVFDAIETELEKETWFTRLLQNSCFEDPGQLADYIMDTVREKGNIDDDLTIIVYKVKEFSKISRKFDV